MDHKVDQSTKSVKHMQYYSGLNFYSSQVQIRRSNLWFQTSSSLFLSLTSDTSQYMIFFLSTEQCDDELPGPQEAVPSQPDDHHLHHTPLLPILPWLLCVCHIRHVEVLKYKPMFLLTVTGLII